LMTSGKFYRFIAGRQNKRLNNNSGNGILINRSGYSCVPTEGRLL
jgi:hypothetical protein